MEYRKNYIVAKYATRRGMNLESELVTRGRGTLRRDALNFGLWLPALEARISGNFRLFGSSTYGLIYDYRDLYLTR